MTVPEGDEVSDLERLAEALDWLDHQPHAEALTAARELRKYRDLLANGERVEWCEEHSSVASLGGMCGHPKRFDTDCHIVSRLLVDPPNLTD